MRIIGHRGAAGVAPENTLCSFRRALEAGLDCVELDVRLTRDGHPVCFHDDRLDRVTPERGLVAEWDWPALSRVPVLPGAFHGVFPDARIPLLAEVLAELPAHCRFLVELKAEPVRPDLLVERAVTVITEARALDRCRLISFHPDLLRRVRERLPEAEVGIIALARDRDRLLPLARELRAVAVHAQHPTVDEAFVAQAQDQGFSVNAWTVNTAEEVRRLCRLGVEEITTDYPDLALSAAADV